MRLVVFITLFLAIVTAISAGVHAVQAGTRSTHTCVAPCTVTLPDDTLEDEWNFDYGWKNKHTPVVGVYANAGHAATDDFKAPGYDSPDYDPHALGMRGVDDVAISQDARGNVTLVQGLWHGKPVVTMFDASLVD